MILDRAIIRNFRSIADATIEFEPACRVLIGVNESGKSNVLAALSLLDSKRPIVPTDIREPGPDEPAVEAAHVYFVFKLSQDERQRVAKRAREIFFPPMMHLATKGGKQLTAEDMAMSVGEVLQVANLVSGKRFAATWQFNIGAKIADGWMKPIGSVEDLKLSDGKGAEVALSALSAVHSSAIPEDKLPLFQKLESADLATFIGAEAKEILAENFPECVYWTYSDSNLLPSQIKKSEFLADPSTCLPLSQMFALSGFPDPKVAFETAEKRSAQGVRNLLERVASRTTAHLKSVWKECGKIEISLRENGLFIDASIRDELNHYSFVSRSDGFKRFVSFLLLISAKERSNGLSNCLYLQDEPDLGLHPSGVKYLRDELIRISRKNRVVVSTHSIFMIDKERIDRHSIVVKESEKTTLRKVETSDILEEEVLHNALGHSVFDHLKPANLIFEGWRDKRLFTVCLDGAGTRIKRIASHRKATGVCHSKGVKDVERVADFLSLAGRKFCVVSDGDAPALEQQRRQKASNPGMNWLRYDELSTNPAVQTAEDFLTRQVVVDALNAVLSEKTAVQIDLDELDREKPVVPQVSAWLAQAGISKDDAKKIQNAWKSTLFDDLDFKHIERDYFEVAQKLVDFDFT